MARPLVTEVTGDPLVSLFGELMDYVSYVTATTAQEELSKAQHEGAMKNPVTFVDNKKGRSEYEVKPFGTITYVSPLGPLKQAVEDVERYIMTRTGIFQHPTGYYASGFRWFINGKPAGENSPDVSQVGQHGNIQIVNLAGYASALEANFMPDGILFGCYVALKSKYGNTLKIAQGYAPESAFDQQWPADHAAQPMTIPYIMLGHPNASFKQRSKKPGHNIRKKARAAAKAAAAGASGGGGHH